MKRITALLFSVLTVLFLSTECLAAPKSAVLMDKNNGRVLFSLNMDERLPMASTTKIMTALIALEQEEKDGYFEVDSSAIKVEGSSMGLRERDFVTLRILAEGMLLASGNDAANAAAVHISGSVPEFVRLMNKRAAEMGLLNTSFETPSGLDGKNHFSTAYDMALLAKNALMNPDFSAICGEKTISAEYGNPPYRRILKNHNRLLGELEGASGVKTGFTEKAGRCLVSAAERNGVSLICVTLCCPDDWEYHRAFYEDYFGKLRAFSPEKPEKILVHVCGGESEKLGLSSEEAKITLYEGEEKLLEEIICIPGFVFAPIKKGDVIGKIIYRLGDLTVAEVPLFAEENIDAIKKEKNIFKKTKEIFS